MTSQKTESVFSEWKADGDFSGAFCVSGPDGDIFRQARGWRNERERLPNLHDTAFGIASGAKMFTGLAACKLIDEKKLALDDKICDALKRDLGRIDKGATIFQLLTHTSGVGDYIDEEAEDSAERLQALRDKYPAHLWESLEYYLQMISPLPMKFEPGARFCYSNSGYVLLGLAIEAASGVSYQRFVHENIIAPCGLERTGFYRADSLPANAARGYMRDDETGEWRSNVFSLPILGGSDGGIFTCADDLRKLWAAIFSGKILSPEMTEAFLKPQARIDEDESYGLGVYRHEKGDDLLYFAVGGDAGVDFFTAYFPRAGLVASALGNTEKNTFSLLEELAGAVWEADGE